MPAKKNVALQVVTETFYELFQNEFEIFDAFDPTALAAYDTLSSVEKRLFLSRLAFHHADKYTLFLQQAEREIVSVRLTDDDFDCVEAWEHALSDERTPDQEPFTQIRFRVRDQEILEHVKVGAVVISRMFDKSET